MAQITSIGTDSSWRQIDTMVPAIARFQYRLANVVADIDVRRCRASPPQSEEAKTRYRPVPERKAADLTCCMRSPHRDLRGEMSVMEEI